MTVAEAPKINVMPFQREVILCRSKFMTLMAGRRAGKTDAIKGRIKYLTTTYPNFRYMYVTPLYSQGEEVYNQLIADMTFRQWVRRYRERPHPRIFLKNGSVINFRSFQRPDGIRSTGENEICIDESQDPKVTETDVDNIIRPMLSDRIGPHGKRGTLLMSGQFRGSDWRYERYYLPGAAQIDGVANPRYKPSLYASWRVPSSLGFAFQTPGGAEELELQRQSIPPAVWEQEWECLPRSNANAVFPVVQVDAIVKTKPKPSGGGYVCGVDIGKIVDPTKVVVLHSSGDVVYTEAFPLGQDHAISAKKATEIAAKYRAVVVVDSTGGGTGGHAQKDSYVKLYRHCAELQKLELREFFWQMANKERIIAQLALAIQQREINILSEFTGLIKELKAYEYKFNENTKHYVYGSPKGQHDDYVAALAMAVEGWKRGWIPSGKPGYGFGNL